MSLPAGLLLFPGAGADRDQATLVALERAVGKLPCVRADFPYRKAGKRAPDKAPVLVESVRTEAADMVSTHRFRPNRLVLGGRSMGGRMCSMAVAEGLPARGLVLVSYPLHPPGKPENLRTAHFPSLDLPCLFVLGTNDPFGTPDEFETHLQAIPGEVEVVWIQGGRHDLRGADATVCAAVTDWLGRLR